MQCTNLFCYLFTLPLQAKSAGDGVLVDKLSADARLMGYQADIAARLEVSVQAFACHVRCLQLYMVRC